MIGEVLGAKPANIALTSSGKRFAMSIDDIMSSEYGSIEGQGGGDVEVSGHPLAPVPGVAFKVGRSDQFKFDDYGIQVDVAQKNAFSTNFAYQP